MRQEIRDSEPGARALAKKHGISGTTACKWNRRHPVAEPRTAGPTLQTTLTPVQEAIVV